MSNEPEPVDGSLLAEHLVGHLRGAIIYPVWIDLFDCGVMMIGPYGQPEEEERDWAMNRFIQSWYTPYSPEEGHIQ